MTDAALVISAKVLASIVINHPKDFLDKLDPDSWPDESKDISCLAQQIIAEVTGLAGIPDIPDGGLHDDF